MRVLRAMPARGLEVNVLFTHKVSTMPPDTAEDFAQEDRIVDLSVVAPDARLTTLGDEIRRRHVGVVLQVGASTLYRHLPYLRQWDCNLQILDILYNELGHVVNHFLYERCLSGVIVESQYMKRYVERCSSLRNRNIELVESGIDINTYKPGPQRAKSSGLVVGYVGRMSPEKNPMGYIELCEQVGAALPSLSFRMVGTGPMEGEVRARVAASTARDNIEYMGFQPDLIGVLNEMDVLVVPSKLDGRPNIIMEANACGLPVIAAPVGGIPELIEEGRNGYLVDPVNVRRVIEILAPLSAQPDELAKIKVSSRAAAEQRFDERRMLDRYEAVFRHYLDKSRG